MRLCWVQQYTLLRGGGGVDGAVEVLNHLHPTQSTCSRKCEVISCSGRSFAHLRDMGESQQVAEGFHVHQGVCWQKGGVCREHWTKVLPRMLDWVCMISINHLLCSPLTEGICELLSRHYRPYLCGFRHVVMLLISTADCCGAGSGCDHPNVVRYLGSYRQPEALWIVMEHCGGGSVGDLLQVKGSGLEEDMIAYICSEALKVRRERRWEAIYIWLLR